ncbi:QWRF motif-containing protein 2-like isoform X1 [Actinidia eriantha]|uniref:QWRF motif-containing protein 2-like isoform X1 n=1 Tax=Actinidia eriantha TaxID=165200 RepID=UPI0025891EA8|nr:QWRF motif-containing protein 2-like isoform X1 [Actinidia eriantha]
MMVAAISGAASIDPQNPKISSRDEAQQNPRRPPLLPSERDNNGVGPKRPKSRQVSSRYMSPSPSSSSASSISSSSAVSRRCPSPLVSRNSTSVSNTPASVPKRSVSVDRRRPVSSRSLAPDLQGNAGGEVSAATKLLITSTRSLSVSFQGEAFSLPISKTKAVAASPNLSSVRRGTPERRRPSTPCRGKVDGGGDMVENSKQIDQHRWPARTRQLNPLSRSLDCTEDKRKVIGSGKAVRALQQSMIDDSRRASFDGRLSLHLSSAELLKAIPLAPNESCVPPDLTGSDTDSVSSGSTSGVQDCGGGARGRSGPRGIVVSARFWQETNSRLRRLQDSGSPTSPAKMAVPPKFANSKKFPSDGPLSSPRAMSSPVRGNIRPASPSKLMTSMGSSPSRGMVSPSRVRNSVVGAISNNFSETPSVLSFAVDVRRAKVGDNRIVDAHLLRLLYNRHLQWRFVNARSETTLTVQKRSAEKNLWNAWITISNLRDSVTKKRHRLQLLRQKLKLASILKGQIICLEDWASLDKDHSASLLGVVEALKANTLRLPVVGGALADVQSVKEAIGSAIDVMQSMTSSLCSILSRVEDVNSLVAELAKVIVNERALLQQCKDFMSMLAAMQVKDCSLRTHILQLNRVPTS